jgi:hypothetical protein
VNPAEAIAAALPTPFRDSGAEGESSGLVRFLLGSCFALASVSSVVAADEGEVRWRVSDTANSALLVIADSDATDNFGSQLFECKKGSGTATAEGDASEDLRSAMAELILHDHEPGVHLTPDEPSAQTLDLAYNSFSGWRYRFELPVTGPAFEQLKRTGLFQFKVADAVVRRIQGWPGERRQVPGYLQAVSQVRTSNSDCPRFRGWGVTCR